MGFKKKLLERIEELEKQISILNQAVKPEKEDKGVAGILGWAKEEYYSNALNSMVNLQKTENILLRSEISKCVADCKSQVGHIGKELDRRTDSLTDLIHNKVLRVYTRLGCLFEYLKVQLVEEHNMPAKVIKNKKHAG